MPNDIGNLHLQGTNEKRIQLPPVEDPVEAKGQTDSGRKDADEMALRETLAFLQSRTGHDFSH